MKLTQHGENLWQLTRLGAFNSYFVREADGLTLIDTNLGGTHKDIVQAAQQIGLPITRITLTHAHGDHVGSLDEIVALTPHAEVVFAQRTEAFLQGDLTLLSHEPQHKLRGSFVTRSTRAQRYLAHGDQFGSLQVVAVPGHAPDLIAFFDTRDGTLIGGDAFQTKAGIAVAGVMRWLFPFPALATWHPPTALASAQILRDLNPARLAVGHGPVIENPDAAMAQAIAKAEAVYGGEIQTA
ncbi:MAG: MBL fold metallo-hydrolase [Litorilinea sp.]